ncbi:acyltransferase [Mucilaginibacter xinganensis]|uniref:Maltose O-acetyltransferase n=1 Tax=Mucilaginibacter xinganensis TaxID=1234841 RepID=A0A223NZ49_9SPHI|nr:acyltransferase [Mucilaginibacter xinganensis]ASU35143.1 maltose O-acetyltransferase [Mucilaginibacter xinganensis]
MLKKIALKIFDKLLEYHDANYYQSLRRKYNIAPDFRFNGKHVQIYGNGKISTGKNSYIGSFSTIQLHEDCEVIIGDNCRISHNVRIYTSSPEPDQDFNDLTSLKIKRGDVVIGNGVWIGVNVFINPGVRIGNNAVVGANSVVTKDIDENTIAGGVPAKVIRVKKD